MTLRRTWLVVDPGKLTGFCWLIASDNGLSDLSGGGELSHFEFLDYAEGVLFQVLPGLQGVVCESFKVTGRTQREIGSDRLYSAEQIGVLRQRCRTSGLSYVEQTPSDAKSFATDDKLRRVGWYKGGKGEKGHHRDAARHAMLFAVRNALLNPALLLDPAGKGVS